MHAKRRIRNKESNPHVSADFIKREETKSWNADYDFGFVETTPNSEKFADLVSNFTRTEQILVEPIILR